MGSGEKNNIDFFKFEIHDLEEKQQFQILISKKDIEIDISAVNFQLAGWFFCQVSQGLGRFICAFNGGEVTTNGLIETANYLALRILGMSWGVKTTCLEAPGVSLGGSGVSIGGVRTLRVFSIEQYHPY